MTIKASKYLTSYIGSTFYRKLNETKIKNIIQVNETECIIGGHLAWLRHFKIWVDMGSEYNVQTIPW